MEFLGPKDNNGNNISWRNRAVERAFRFEQVIETRLAHFKQTPREIPEYVMHDMFVGPGLTKEIVRGAILFPHVLCDKVRDLKLASICASLRVGLAVAKAASGVLKFI